MNLICRVTVILILLFASLISAEEKRAIRLDDMFDIKRVSDPVISPDGKWIVYTVTTPDLDANKTSTDLWLVPVNGGQPRQLTGSSAHDRNAAWSADSKWIAFESTRSGDSQIWIIGMEGGEARQFTHISTEASSPLWSPDGKSIAFVSSVYPEFSEKAFDESDKLNREKDKQRSDSKVKARLITGLLYRHWDSWVDDKRQHIFIQQFPDGKAKNLTPGNRDAAPTSTTFSSARRDFDFSPDSTEIAYTATPEKNEAWSTNHDLFTVSISNGERKQITTNEAADITPKYSRDGKWIAYLAQNVPQFEADRWQIILYDRKTGNTKSLTERFDASPSGHIWSDDGKSLIFSTQTEGRAPIYKIAAAGGEPQKIYDEHTAQDLSTAGSVVAFARSSATRSAEVCKVQMDGQGITKLSGHNDGLFAKLDVPAPESVLYQGSGAAKIQAWLYKPPSFDAAKKYPFVYLVHGGPQSAWVDSWSFRWNPALWAAQGYIVMAPNPRGSTGFGQQFTNEISKDWGGKVFEDLMKGVDYAESLPYVDKNRKAAAGASYGGYAIFWFAGNTDRFKTLISHDGVFNFESMYGTTEEIWFSEYEYGGPYWESPAPDSYQKFSPHRFVQNWKTPMLIVHGENDFRVPVSEGLQAFSALQRKGIPSKLLYFPDEGHWVLKPANSKLWHQTVFAWLEEYLK